MGRFEVKQLLGEGGFGRVYRAYDPQLDRYVALKLPTFSPTDKNRAQRFLIEARSAAQLRHPHIVPTFDSGQVDGKFFIASQFIDGQPLNDIIKQGKVDPEQAAALIAKVADAVQYAHDQGIVHRDIKPHNIMMDQKRQPQLMDFGLAKRLADDSSMTVDGSLMGTPAYMSPEQAVGDHGRVGPHSDQYSVGVVLYELLTGQKPFDGSPHSVISKVVNTEAKPIRQLDGSLPVDLDAICQKAMAKSPRKRYATTGDLASDLRAYLSGEATTARPPSVAERTLRWCRRNQRTAAMLGTTLAALVLGTATSSFFAFRAYSDNERALAAERSAKDEAANARRAEKEAETALKLSRDSAAKLKQAKAEAETDRDRAKDAEKDAKNALAMAESQKAVAEKALARASFLLAHVRADQQRPNDGLAALDEVPKAERNVEWFIKKRQLAGADVILYGHSEEVVAVEFVPDTNRVVSTSRDLTTRLWDLESSKELARVATDTAILSLYCSDSSRITSIDTTGECRHLSGTDLTDVSWPLENVREFWISQRSQPEIGRALRDFAIPAGIWYTPRVSSHRMPAFRFPIDGTSPALADLEPKITSMAIAPSDLQFVLGRSDGRIRLCSPTNPRKRTWRPAHDTEVFAVTSAPSGQFFVTVGRKQVRVWSDTLSPRSSLPASDPKCLAINPDASDIAVGYGDGAIRIWSTVTNELSQVLVGHVGAVNSVVYSPDARKLISGGQDGTVRCWDTRMTRDPAHSAIHIGNLEGLLTEAVAPKTSGHPNSFQFASIPGSTEVWLVSASSQDTYLRIDANEGKHQPAASPFEKLTDDFVIDAKGPGQGYSVSPIGLSLDFDGSLRSLIISPDKSRLAIIGQDRSLHIWDTKTKKKLLHQQAGLSVADVAISPDCQQFAVARKDRVELWSADTAEILAESLTDRELTAVAFTWDGTRLLTGATDGSVLLHESQSTEELLALRESGPGIQAVATSEGGSRLFALSGTPSDATLHVWESSLQATPDLVCEPPDKIIGMSVCDSGRHLMIETKDARAVYDTDSLVEVYRGKSGDNTAMLSALPSARFPKITHRDSIEVGRHRFLRVSNSILRVDMLRRENPVERSRRQWQVVSSAPHWHRTRVKSSSTDFERLFHYCWLLKTGKLSGDERTIAKELAATLVRRRKAIPHIAKLLMGQ